MTASKNEVPALQLLALPEDLPFELALTQDIDLPRLLLAIGSQRN